MHRPTNSILIAVSLIATAACAGSKQASPTLPAPLVNALLSDGRSIRLAPRYSVGSLTEEYPRALQLSGSGAVVGGMTNGDEVIGVFVDSARALAPVFESLFVQAGYTRPAPTPGSGFNSGTARYGFFCRDSGFVSVAQLTGADRHLARVTYRRTRVPMCETMNQSRAQPELMIPELKPPPGVRIPNSGGGSGDGVNARAEMTGRDLVPAAILAHYAAQLSAAGWKGDSPAVSERVAAQFFEARSAAGQPWQGTMIVTGSATALTLTITMHPKSP